MNDPKEARVKQILATVKPLAAEYYRLTGKPLGVTGEVAEYIAAEVLNLQGKAVCAALACPGVFSASALSTPNGSRQG